MGRGPKCTHSLLEVCAPPFPVRSGGPGPPRPRIFLGPVSVGDAGGDAGLVVDVSATPGVAVALGVSQKRQCPPPARLTCAEQGGQ